MFAISDGPVHHSIAKISESETEIPNIYWQLSMLVFKLTVFHPLTIDCDRNYHGIACGAANQIPEEGEFENLFVRINFIIIAPFLHRFLITGHK